MLTLVNQDALKSYLEITHDGDNTLLEFLAQTAEARWANFNGTPLTVATFTEHHRGGGEVLILNHKPVQEITSVTDTHGTVDGSDDELLETWQWRLDKKGGLLYHTTEHGGQRHWYYGLRRYKVIYKAGWEADARWDVRMKEEVEWSLMRLISHWYENRNPDLKSENFGGMGIQLRNECLPAEVKAIWEPYAPCLWVGGTGEEDD